MYVDQATSPECSLAIDSDEEHETNLDVSIVSSRTSDDDAFNNNDERYVTSPKNRSSCIVNTELLNGIQGNLRKTVSQIKAMQTNKRAANTPPPVATTAVKRIYSNEFTCEICSKIFRLKGDLRIHSTACDGKRNKKSSNNIPVKISRPKSLDSPTIHVKEEMDDGIFTQQNITLEEINKFLSKRIAKV